MFNLEQKSEGVMVLIDPYSERGDNKDDEVVMCEMR